MSLEASIASTFVNNKCAKFKFSRISDFLTNYFDRFQILHGHSCYKNSLKNFRSQMSPLMAELLIASDPIDDILKMGEEKYFGCVAGFRLRRFLHSRLCRCNQYLSNLELEFATPECHLHLIGHRRGILGHSKYLYDTMLNLNEEAVKKMPWSEAYDPYGLVKRAFVTTHTSEDFGERFDHRLSNLSLVETIIGH